MTVLPLVIAPDERLNIPSRKVEVVNDAIRKLARDMIDTMYANKGIGLAAVQVGEHKRMIVVDTSVASPRYANQWDDDEDDTSSRPPMPMVLINPEIIEASKEMATFAEGCLSFPDHYSDVDRPAAVTVAYLDEQGKPQTIKAKGVLSVCIQHEIDHVNGVVFVDHISKLKRDMILRKLKKAKKLGTLEMEEQPYHA